MSLGTSNDESPNLDCWRMWREHMPSVLKILEQELGEEYHCCVAKGSGPHHSCVLTDYSSVLILVVASCNCEQGWLLQQWPWRANSPPTDLVFAGEEGHLSLPHSGRHGRAMQQDLQRHQEIQCAHEPGQGDRTDTRPGLKTAEHFVLGLNK